MEKIILSDREVEEARGRIPWQRIEEFLFGNRWVVVGGLLGLILLGTGVFFLRAGVFEGTRIEVIESGEEARLRQGYGEAKEVVVEIAGEVISPGVYKLELSGRVEDLLVAAGGLAGNADREWVEKNLNRAARLADGQKVYVPSVQEVSSGTWEAGSGLGSGIVGGVRTGLININTASQAQLDTLWQIGPERAKDIIEGRPYASVEELLTRKIIYSNVYERIKDEITAP